jgi:hypothetical protein
MKSAKQVSEKMVKGAGQGTAILVEREKSWKGRSAFLEKLDKATP